MHVSHMSYPEVSSITNHDSSDLFLVESVKRDERVSHAVQCMPCTLDVYITGCLFEYLFIPLSQILTDLYRRTSNLQSAFISYCFTDR